MDRPGLRAPALILAALVLAGCGGGGPRARAEAAALRRQAETLRGLIAAAGADEAFSSRHVTLAIAEELVRDLLQLTLPIEAELAPDLRIRLETARVSFQNGESRVTLSGRVSRASSSATFADLEVHGGLHRFHVVEDAGSVSARVALERVEVRQAQAEGLRRELVEAVLGQLGAPALEGLAAQIPPLTVPVRFERRLEIEAARHGPFEIAAGSLALRVTLAQVVPLGGRLWLMLDASAAPAQDAPRARAGAEALP